MSGGIRSYIEQHAPVIDRALGERMPVSSLSGAERLNDAVHYALFSGGKRMRPVMVLLSAELCGAKPHAAMTAACGVEFLHAASLILDDLPAMDDAAVRRGFPTVHTVFGEDMALLAAVALMNEAYAAFAEVPSLLRTAVREIGISGMIGGQAADVCGAHSRSRLQKTTALTRLAMACGAESAGACRADTEAVVAFGEALGEAYQICDDMVDAFSTDAESGKTTGQDQRHRRWNSMTELEGHAACERVHLLIEVSLERIRGRFGRSREAELLKEFAWSIVGRGLELVKDDSASVSIRRPHFGSVERDPLAGGAGA
ncbi:MAG: Polyprenyl synthetase [Bryobacterales bacterium]|nr:Polyprenyl synthetase [Bryobacterales bacterium]